MIKLENITKQFEGKSILKGVSLEVNKNDTFLIIGRSGAGKSVLLRIMAGLIHPDSGVVKIDGININNLRENELNRIRLEMGIVFQSGALFDSLTVRENVGFALFRHSNLAKEEIENKINHSLELVGLKEAKNKYPYQLSGGMRKRAAIARAICFDPKILIYDEPTTGIDPISIDRIVNLIKELHRQLSVTSVVVTHDMDVAYKIATEAAFLFGGRIIFNGKIEELKESADPKIRQFLSGNSSGPIQETEV